MSQCVAIRRDGTRCSQESKDGGRFCVVHLNHTGAVAEGEEAPTTAVPTTAVAEGAVEAVFVEYGPSRINIGSKWVGQPISTVLATARTVFGLAEDESFESLINGEGIIDREGLVPSGAVVTITKGRSTLG